MKKSLVVMTKSVFCLFTVFCAVVASATTYVWNGPATDGTWSNTANWLVSGVEPESVPTSDTSANFEFPQSVTTEVDLGNGSYTINKHQVLRNADVTIKNGTLSFATPEYTGSANTVLAGASLTFDKVDVTVRRGGTHYTLIYGAEAWLKLVNESSLTVSDGA